MGQSGIITEVQAEAPSLPQALPDGKICDFIDGTIRNDTPEEYVRQNIERRLVLELGYKPEQIKVEFPIKIGSQRGRIDIAVFEEGRDFTVDNVRIAVECKSDAVPPTSKKDGIDQLKSYMAVCPNIEWGMWTNGQAKAVYRWVRGSDGKKEEEEPNDLPSRDGSPDEVDRPSRDTLLSATDDNLLFSFKISHNHIYVTDGMQKQPAFFELLKVIFCKILDERNVPSPLEFFATGREKMTNDGRLTVKNRIGKIFSRVKKRYPAIFDEHDQINLQPRSLAAIVGELQRYSFLDTAIDVKGKAYEELVGSNLRGDRGEFFTPRNVQRMAIRMLDLKVTKEQTILDPACGTGGFLVIAMHEVIQQLLEVPGMKTAGMRKALVDRIQEVAQRHFFGIDINPDLVKATKMNMVMNNDGSGNIMRQDSLLHPHQWSAEFRDALAKSLDVKPATLRGPKDLALFDVVATNPPFGAKLPINDRETLSQYDLGHVWRDQGNGVWEKTSDVQTSQPPEILFIERCWQFLKPGGRMAIVLPDAILGAPGLLYVRQWIMRHCRVVASIDLHPDTFQPRNGTQTSVLILQRKTQAEIDSETISRSLRDYEIFMASVGSIGHDKRGQQVFRRDADGEILYFPDTEAAAKLETTSSGHTTARRMPKVKRLDDDTPAIADEFLCWKEKAVLGW